MIYEGDVVVLKSEVLLDTPDGGGAMTNAVVVDGASNNLFPDISELDRTYGRIALRKFFPAVLTTSVDSYYGVHAIISKKPTDPRVHASLFSTVDWFDRRVSAKDRIERYLARGPKWAGHVLEMQLAGQRAIQQVTRVLDPEPKVGQGLVLTYHEGISGEYEQFVRVTKVTSSLRTFVVQSKDLDRKVLLIELSDPLRYNFNGPSVAEFELNGDLTNRAVLRDTSVANAATYYGISPVTVDAALSYASVTVASIFTQLVPASQAETAMVDLYGAGFTKTVVPGNTGTVSIPLLGVTMSANSRIYIGTPIMPGTLSFSLNGITVTDSGGDLISSTTRVGGIEYDKGLLTFSSSIATNTTGNGTAVFQPAAAPTQSQYSDSIFVSQSTRGSNYVRTLLPIPSPGSLAVSYIAQGKVYYLFDNGAGALKGVNSAAGTGSVNYVTGNVLITLAALPDADTDILYTWGTAISTFARNNITVQPVAVMFATGAAIGQGTLAITWTDGTTTKTVTDNSVGGLQGSGTGTVDYGTGVIYLRPTLLPSPSTVYAVAISTSSTETANITGFTWNGSNNTTVVLPDRGNPIVPGTLSVTWAGYLDAVSMQHIDPYTPTNTQVSRYTELVAATANDVGTGGSSGAIVCSGNTVGGSIVYATRTLTINVANNVVTRYPVYNTVGQPDGVGGYVSLRSELTGWNTATGLVLPSAPYTLRAQWRVNIALTTGATNYTAPSLDFNLTPLLTETIVEGSVRFTLGGLAYVDRAGTLYHSVSPLTGAGTFAGSINYTSGKVSLVSWVAGGSPTLVVQSLTTQIAANILGQIVFRVPIVPVRPSSVQMRFLPLDSTTEITVTADTTGAFSNAWAYGKIDYASGLVKVVFGKETLITVGNRASIMAKFWYNSANEYIVAGNSYIVWPHPIYPSSFRYNAVGYTYLPLSADILGLDPVRLPPDGRVPIFQLGSVVVIHNTTKPVFPSPTVSSTLDVGRTRISYGRLYDSLGARLPDNMYTTNLLTGIVTLTSLFSLTGYTVPLYVENRIEDMALLTDVQINGRLTLSKPLTHAYPMTSSFVSSALIIADLQARAHTVFSQSSWTAEWQDSRIGAEILAQYNNVLYPIITTNMGAIQEQWAIIFTSNSSFRVVGRNVGQVMEANTSNGIAPPNPNFSGSAYFTMAGGPSLGSGVQWGAGWVAGNVIRFNTSGANYPVWAVRTVLQGEATEINDNFQLAIRGDIDRP